MGHNHTSGLEASVCAILQKSTKYEIVRTEVTHRLGPAPVIYRADFELRELITGKLAWAEAKGHEGPRWPNQKRNWKVFGPGDLLIYKGTEKYPVLVETIVPKRSSCPHCNEEL